MNEFINPNWLHCTIRQDVLRLIRNLEALEIEDIKKIKEINMNDIEWIIGEKSNVNMILDCLYKIKTLQIKT